jgi:hypothetical protein
MRAMIGRGDHLRRALQEDNFPHVLDLAALAMLAQQIQAIIASRAQRHELNGISPFFRLTDSWQRLNSPSVSNLFPSHAVEN